MKTFAGICLLVVCCGCSDGNTTSMEGVEQDEIAAYVEANPNVDAGLDEIDETDDGTGN